MRGDSSVIYRNGNRSLLGCSRIESASYFTSRLDWLVCLGAAPDALTKVPLPASVYQFSARSIKCDFYTLVGSFLRSARRPPSIAHS